MYGTNHLCIHSVQKEFKKEIDRTNNGKSQSISEDVEPSKGEGVNNAYIHIHMHTHFNILIISNQSNQHN